MKAITAVCAVLALFACAHELPTAEASFVHWNMPQLTVRPFMQWRDPFEEFNRMWNNVIAQQQHVWSCQKHCSNVAARALSSAVTVTETELPTGETALVHSFPGVRAADVSVEVTGDRLAVRASRPLATSSPTAARDAECGCPVDVSAGSVTTVTSNGLCRTRTVSAAAGSHAVETVERLYTLPRYTATDAVAATLTESATADETGAPATDFVSELTIRIPKAVQPQAKAVPIAVTKTVAPPAPKPAIAAPVPAAAPVPVASAAQVPANPPAPAVPSAAAVESDVIDLDTK